MYRKIRNILFILFRLRFMLLIWLKIKGIFKGNIRLYNNASVDIDDSAKIEVKSGEFHFNKKWAKNDPFPSHLEMRSKATLIIEDSFKIYSGARVSVNTNAVMILGKGYIGNNVNLHCFTKIEIGKNVAISENVCIRDCDNHDIISDSSHTKSKPIIIGNNVWIGMNCTILKGVTIGDNSIIAAGSIVNKDVPSNCLAAGVPAKIIKENVSWK